MSDEGTVLATWIEVAGDPRTVFDAFLEDLAAGLTRQGLTLEPRPCGRIVRGGRDVGRVVAWELGWTIPTSSPLRVRRA